MRIKYRKTKMLRVYFGEIHETTNPNELASLMVEHLEGKISSVARGYALGISMPATQALTRMYGMF